MRYRISDAAALVGPWPRASFLHEAALRVCEPPMPSTVTIGILGSQPRHSLGRRRCARAQEASNDYGYTSAN